MRSNNANQAPESRYVILHIWIRMSFGFGFRFFQQPDVTVIGAVGYGPSSYNQVRYSPGGPQSYYLSRL